jgi:hypothetical protein
MASVDAKQPRRGIDDLAAIRLEVVHAFGAGKEARAFFEGAIGGEGDPIGLELIGLHVERGHGSLRGFQG